MVGRRLLHFDVVKQLGEGGMGVVWKARDTHLDRFVAIKVLPAEKVADPERRRRFVQEAKAASALNHPNIIIVHDITQADGLDFIVMEHVDGKSLDALIPRAGMRLSEVLKIGAQIARALTAAHAHGITHRDLKPANVMVASGGTVKVLDFGLAKLTEPASDVRGSEMPTGQAGTGAGVILGTAAYMSPEQAEGKPVDARSDIFAFGAVLYEMATGRQAFTGDSWASMMAAVLNREPQPLEGLPHDLQKCTHRCLRKDPDKRFQHMDDVCVALEELKDESDSGKLGVAAPAPSRAPTQRRLMYGAAVIVLVLAAAAVVWRWAAPPAPSPAPRLVPLTTFPGYEYTPAFSPDGKQVAFAWSGPNEDNFDIYVMLVGTATPVRLTTDPAYSSDGRRIAFASSRSGGFEIWVCNADGSNQAQVTRLGAPVTGSPQWSPDGKTIAFDSDAEGQTEIYTISADGGPPRRLTDHPGMDVVPTWSRDGRWLYFMSDRSGTRQPWKLPAEGGTPVQITTHGGGNATESADGGTLYYNREEHAPGMVRRSIGAGDEALFLEVPEVARWWQVAVARNGVYYLGPDNAGTRPVRYAIFFYEFATGKTTRVAPLEKTPQFYTRGLAVSPDGRSLLYTQLDASGSDLMLLENLR